MDDVWQLRRLYARAALRSQRFIDHRGNSNETIRHTPAGLDVTFQDSFKIETMAEQYFDGPDALPATWLRRKQHPDFHVDYIVEIDQDEAPSGIKFAVQLKGAKSLRVKSGHVSYRLETKHLQYYVDRSPEPVFLVLVDTTARRGYWISIDRWAKDRTDWRRQKSTTLSIPIENLIGDSESFRRAIESDVRLRRSTATAAMREARELEQLDERFAVKVSYRDGQTRFDVLPKQPVSGSVKLRGPDAAGKFVQLVESGQPINFSPGELSFTGSQLFRHVFEDLATAPFSLQAAKRVDCQVSMLTVSQTGARDEALATSSSTLVAGTKELRFNMVLDRAPLAVECAHPLGRAGSSSKGSMRIFFEYSKWLGQELVLAAHFEALYRLVKLIVNQDSLSLRCDVDGNELIRAPIRMDDTAPFVGIAGALELLHRARVVARYLGVRPPMPELGLLVASEGDILYLWELVQYGEVSATVQNLSVEAVMSVRDLRKALGAAPAGSESLLIHALEACPAIFGTQAKDWALQRAIPVQVASPTSNDLASATEEDDSISVRLVASPGTVATTKLVRLPEASSAN